MRIINITNDLRDDLAKKVESERLSLRQIQEHSGVSFATLSRFLRGAEIGSATYDSISIYLKGGKKRPHKVIQSKRITLGKDAFLITIEKVA